MGRLKEILQREQFQGAADPVKLVTEDRRSLELRWKRERREKAQEKAAARKAVIDQETALNLRLRGLLKAVSAQEALKDMKSLWGGKVDRVPYKIKNAAEMLVPYDQSPVLGLPPQPALGIALRHRFQDVADASVICSYWTGDYAYDGLAWFNREMFVATIVGFDEGDVPYVASFYGSRISDTEYYLYENRKKEGKIKGHPDYCLGWAGRDKILPGDQDVSKILVSQLARINEQAISFKVEEAQAIERIHDSDGLPRRLQDRYSPFFQRRLAANIPVVNRFLSY
ncbi:hypothetical protein M1437_04410 [Patescibacteria group bacterium]|nr:hypothetical protein [Patescibacteria group bacterium]